MPAYVGLLRGINVGGKNILPMKDLSGLFEQAGCAGVRTYIQSGNVLFRATGKVAGKVPGMVAKSIMDRYGYRTPVLLRTVEELAETIGNNPFLQAGAADNGLHVMFLEGLPDALRIAALDPQRSPGDLYHVRGREIYLQCPNGAGQSKLTNAYFDSKLATVSTARNWRTVLKLFELLSESST